MKTARETYFEGQKAWLEENGVEVGSRVVVGGKPASFGDWGYCWPPAVDELVGETLEVMDISPHHGLRLGKGGRWHWFPFFVLTAAKPQRQTVAEPTYADLQAKWVKENNIKPGSRVKVVAKAISYERGWKDLWMPRMGEAIGREWVVAEVNHNIRLRLPGTVLGFPYFVLEPAEPLLERWAVIPKGSSLPSVLCSTRREAEEKELEDPRATRIVHLREVRDES